MGGKKCLIGRDFLDLIFAPKSVLKMDLFGQNGPQNGHYGAGKGRRLAVFAQMLPLYHPGGMGAGLGPIR